MECSECSSVMLLETAVDGVEVYTCPYCGASDSVDMLSSPCYDEVWMYEMKESHYAE